MQLKKCRELGLLVPLEELKDEDEEEDLVLGSAGLSKALLKEFDNLLLLVAYNDREEDRESGKFMAKQLGLIVDRKELNSTK